MGRRMGGVRVLSRDLRDDGKQKVANCPLAVLYWGPVRCQLNSSGELYDASLDPSDVSRERQRRVGLLRLSFFGFSNHKARRLRCR